LIAIPFFIDCIQLLEPTWKDLKKLNREHVLKYIEQLHIKANKIRRKYADPHRYVNENLGVIQKFIEDLQRFENKIAPEKHIRKLIFSEDRLKRKKKPYDQIHYIPDFVLEQFFGNVKYLHEEVQPIIWITFKTGLRISDTLELTHDCLIKLNGKYKIVTDIKKTYVQGHTIPIDDELANILAVLINRSKELSNENNNPHNYIFVRYRGSRKGKPYMQSWINTQLNIFAKKCNIKDEQGNIFYFKTHQFRHTYAVKMLNGGADILTVQELLAHASPEMTMQYAKLLDDTKRKVFEKVIKQGVFSFNFNGEVQEIKPNEDIPNDILEMLWQNHKLSAIDNPYGTCHARINGNCPYAEEPPCLTCNGGSPCKDLAIGFSELDSNKYELLVKTTTKTIEALERLGRDDIVAKNKKNLIRYKNILTTIQEGNIIFGRLERMKVRGLNEKV
jgi:integrase